MIKPILIHSDGAIHSHVIKIILDKSNKTTEEKIEILESFIITNDNAYQKESFILLQKKERDKLPKPLDEVIKNNNIKFYINPRNPHNIDKEGFFPNEEKDGPYQLKEGEKIESRLGKIINGKQKERKYVITGEKKELIVQIAHGNKLFFETLSDQSQAHGYESSDSADDNYILTDN